MTGTPKGSTESGFMEKPGIEPATPGLQGIALIHYTTGASHGGFRILNFNFLDGFRKTNIFGHMMKLNIIFVWGGHRKT